MGNICSQSGKHSDGKGKKRNNRMRGKIMDDPERAEQMRQLEEQTRKIKEKEYAKKQTGQIERR